MDQKGRFRRLVTWAFGIVSIVAIAVFEQAISAFATQRGWDKIFINGWAVVSDIGLEGAVAFGFFALGGATLALWIENKLRDRREYQAHLASFASHCTASFRFSKSKESSLSVALDEENSENVSYWAWYVNNGGTMHNAAALLFVASSKDVAAPEIFASASNADEQEWRQFVSTDRFILVEMKGWPRDKVVVQAFDSKRLGLDRRSELMVWRACGPV